MALASAIARHYRELVVFGAVALGALMSVATDGRVELVDGLLYDLALPVVPFREAARPPRVAVVALDQASLASPRLEAVPRVFFGPHFAALIEGLLRADARAVGFDIILGFSASRFEAMKPEYDEPLLSALADHRDRVVLARTASTKVAEPYVAALFDPDRDAGRDEPQAVAYSELVPSDDGVQRWVFPEFVSESGAKLPTLASRLATIAGGPAASAPFLLAPHTPLESIPTYSFASVLDCMEKNPALVRKAFADKVVLVGSNLTEEDRKRAPDRFLSWRAPPARAEGGGCVLETLGSSGVEGVSIPGVHVHAAAVDSMLARSGVTLAPPAVRVGVAALVALVCAVLALFLSPIVAVGALIGVVTLLFGASVVGIGVGRWLPVAVPAFAATVALLGGQLARFFYTERKRKLLERAFGHYLAPAIVAQLADNEEEVRLGGELREVTVIFADLSGFTSTSDTMGPGELMELTNRYLTVMVESIDEHGGYVDKFIGDAVMAIWGAPSTVQDTAGRAMACCFDILRRVRALKESRAGIDPAGFDVKVGFASGPAIVGNVGAPRRLSYTALGATINLAARLEKVCSDFGCPIVVDQVTMTRLRDRYLFCELDTVPLRGKRDLVPVYEAIAPVASATAAQRDYVERYEGALRAYREQQWETAKVSWLELQSTLGERRGTVAPQVMAEKAIAQGA
jgi:adenylate cyclase